MHAWSTCVVKILLKVGGHALNRHGNYIVDQGKSWNCVFEFLWEPCTRHLSLIPSISTGYQVSQHSTMQVSQHDTMYPGMIQSISAFNHVSQHDNKYCSMVQSIFTGYQVTQHVTIYLYLSMLQIILAWFRVSQHDTKYISMIPSISA